MKAFQITGDENRIYFQNLNRRPGEEELAEVLKILNANGCRVGSKTMAGIEDMYRCKMGGKEFDVIFTGEESIVYCKEMETVKEILQLFE